MKLQTVALLALVPLVASSCVVRIGGGSDSSSSLTSKSVRKAKSPSKVASDNRRNLACLTAGMAVADVLQVMEEESWGSGSSTRIANPHRRESFPMAAGGQADVLFFYTDTRKEDGLIGEDELTPVYFENGQLVGWGPFGFDSWRERVLGL